jgi:hypothetical protein
MYQNCCHSQNTTIDLEFIGLPLPIRPVCHDISVSSPLLSFSSRRSRCLGPLRNPPTTVLSHAAITRHYWSSHQDPRGTWIGGTYNRNAATLKYRGPIYLHTFALCPGRHRRHVGTEIQGLWWEAAWWGLYHPSKPRSGAVLSVFGWIDVVFVPVFILVGVSSSTECIVMQRTGNVFAHCHLYAILSNFWCLWREFGIRRVVLSSRKVRNEIFCATTILGARDGIYRYVDPQTNGYPPFPLFGKLVFDRKIVVSSSGSFCGSLGWVA